MHFIFFLYVGSFPIIFINQGVTEEKIKEQLESIQSNLQTNMKV